MHSVERFRYEDVPGLGTVIFPPEVISKLWDTPQAIIEVEQCLEFGADTKAVGKPYSGYREGSGMRLLFRTRPHMKGAAAVCIDGYRVKP